MSDKHTRIQDATIVELAHERDQIHALIEEIISRASDAGFSSSSTYAIRLALVEGITNAFEHGHETVQNDPPIRVEYRITPEVVEVAIEDQGPGFEPEKLPDPTLEENLSNPRGRGVMLMRAYMSEVVYNEIGNRVKLRYELPH
jgi:serine/threonine-protein kinase RsbW